MELELLQWPDGSIHLYYADYMHGGDRDFVLHIDGSCEETITHEDVSESYRVIDLVLVLREMLQSNTPTIEQDWPVYTQWAKR